MKTPKLLVSALILAILLAACSEPPPVVPVDTTRPVKTLLIEAQDIDAVRSFPAVIDAGRKAELAFRIPGTVQELPVKEGEKVVEGEVVARLDKKDYQIVLNDHQARYNNAKKNFARGKELIKDGFISRVDFDRLEAEYESTKSAFESASQDLEYTDLKAPFSGVLAKRHIDAFQEVAAKQTIMELQDVNYLEVKVEIPENLVRAIRETGKYDKTNRDSVPMNVSFENLPGESFDLTFKEVATRADPQTQTFQVTYTMDQLESTSIFPGMTATATADFTRIFSKGTVFAVPSSAIVGDYKLEPAAWVVDEKSMTVKPRPVKVGRLLGDKIEVLGGLEPGDRIVTAGAAFLDAGMKITLLKQSEQAQPRPEDLKYQ